MPEIGERKKGFEIGLKNRNWYVWSKCPTCEQARWVSAASLSFWTAVGIPGQCRECGTNEHKVKGTKQTCQL